MYDSRDVIVTELQMWLARRLLAVKNFDYEEDVSRIVQSWTMGWEVSIIDGVFFSDTVGQGGNTQDALW